MSLRLKFILILMLFCVGVGINIYAAIWANRVLLAEATTAFQAADEASTSVAYLRQALSRQRVVLKGAVEAGGVDSASLGEVIQLSDMARTEIGRLSGVAAPEGLAGEIEALAIALDSYVREVGKLTEDNGAIAPKQAPAALQTLLDYESPALDDRLQRLAATLVQARHAAAASMSGGSQTVNLILVCMAALEFCILMILLSLFRNWIIEPIAGISVATDQIAGGNLAYRLEHNRNDELGALAVQVNDMAEALDQTQRELKQSERMAAVGEMVSVVAHNIRNPLAGIRATAQAALHEAPRGSQPDVLQRRIIDSVDSLEQWLKELLHLNRPLELNVEATPLDELVGDLQLIFKPTLEKRKVDLDYRPDEPRQVIHVDRQHFIQAMASILDNAIEASPAGSSVELRAAASNGRFRIEISDSGSGIPEGLYKQVFESYFSTKPGGTGIGLSMAKKIIEAHSGELSVVRNGAHGSAGATFRIEIKRLPDTRRTGAAHG